MNHRQEHGAASHPAGDRLGELLRVAGPPAEISSERTARHKALARARWEQKVRHRTRRRRLGLALAAAALLALAMGWSLLPSHQGAENSLTTADLGLGPAAEAPRRAAAARLEVVAGSVQTLSDDSTAAPRATDVVERGAELETGPESRAALRLASGHAVRLDVDTRVRLVSATVLALDRGAVYIDSFEAHAGTAVEIRTPLGVATDIGTRFEVRLRQDSLRVRVREGIVQVTNGDQSHQARTGAELTLDAAGHLEHRAVPVYGAAWQWSLEVAPPFEIEGRTLDQFLAWVRRETGWRLRIEDPAVAAGLTRVVLSGSIAGLSMTDALDVVLPTSGLRHRLAEGVLIVEPIR